MRSGNLAGGSKLYHESLGLAVDHKLGLLWCRAAAHFAVEIARHHKTSARYVLDPLEKVVSRLDDSVKKVHSDIEVLIERAKKASETTDLITLKAPMGEISYQIPTAPAQ